MNGQWMCCARQGKVNVCNIIWVRKSLHNLMHNVPQRNIVHKMVKQFYDIL